MMKLKNRDFGFIGSLLLIIMIGIFLFIAKIREHNLDHYLNLLGNQVIAMVPDRQDKERIANQYAEFLNKVKAEELPAEKVKQVASQLLNLAAQDTLLSGNDVSRLLNLSELYPAEFSRLVEFSDQIQEPSFDSLITEIDQTAKTSAVVMAEEYEKIGQRLKLIIELNSKIQILSNQDSLLKMKMPKKYKYIYDNNLRLIVDDKLKSELKNSNFENIGEEIENLERQRVIIWHKEIEKAKQKTIPELSRVFKNKISPDSLKQLKELEKLKFYELNLKRDSLGTEIKE